MVTHHTSTMLNIAGCYFESFNSFEQKLGALSTICSCFKAQHVTFFPSYVLKERANLFFFSGISGLQKAFQSGGNAIAAVKTTAADLLFRFGEVVESVGQVLQSWKVVSADLQLFNYSKQKQHERFQPPSFLHNQKEL